MITGYYCKRSPVSFSARELARTKVSLRPASCLQDILQVRYVVLFLGPTIAKLTFRLSQKIKLTGPTLIKMMHGGRGDSVSIAKSSVLDPQSALLSMRVRIRI
jgi:hypothetical protein